MTAKTIQRSNTLAALINDNDLPGLESACLDLLDEDPDHASALEILTAVYLDTGRPMDAERLSKRRIALDTKSATAHRDLGTALLAQNRKAEALGSFQEAIRQDSSLAGAYFGLGSVHAAHGNLSEAVTAFNHALTNDPSHASAQIALAQSLVKQGQTFLALTTLQRLTESQPTLAAPNLWAGNLLQETGQLEAALKKFEIAAQLEPTFLNDITNRSVLLRQTTVQDRSPDTLFAFFDLSVSPLTFNFIHYLVLAEMHRQEIGYEKIHLVVVPGPIDGYGNEMSNDDYLQQQGRDWRLYNLVVAGCRLLPSCTGITVCTSRQEAYELQESLSGAVFPDGYRANISFKGRRAMWPFSLKTVVKKARQGCPVAYVQATPYARNFVETWCGARSNNRPVISITLRNHEYMPDRNSDIESWAKFCHWADSVGFFPVIVPDTDSLQQTNPPEFDGFAICREASLNVDLRAALYEQSYISLQTGTGPNTLLYHSDNTRFVVLKLIVSSYIDTQPNFFQDTNGIKEGEQLPWTKPWQRLAYVEDTFENIQRQFCEIVDIVERHKDDMDRSTFLFPSVSY